MGNDDATWTQNSATWVQNCAHSSGPMCAGDKHLLVISIPKAVEIFRNAAPSRESPMKTENKEVTQLWKTFNSFEQKAPQIHFL